MSNDNNIIETLKINNKLCVNIMIDYCKNNKDNNLSIEDYYVILMLLLYNDNCSYKKFNELSLKLLHFVKDWNKINYNPFGDQYYSIILKLHDLSGTYFNGIFGFYTPLSMFCKTGNFEMVKHLVDMGHDINRTYHGFSDLYCIIDIYEEALLSPFAIATKYDHYDICRYLTSKEAIFIDRFDYVSEIEYKQSCGQKTHTLDKKMKNWNKKMFNELIKKNEK
jgi:hypothetical protein